LDIRLETAIAAQELSDMDIDEQLGTLSRFTCPECGGALWEITEGSLLRYRCHVGHAFTAEAVLDAQTNEAEEMLWGLMRSHQERAALVRRMAERERAENNEEFAEQLEQRAREYDEGAAVVSGMLRGRMVRAGSKSDEPDDA
jgi:two-component system, chemotaxis family, protein-glutamate methylesterase/glutaminase